MTDALQAKKRLDYLPPSFTIEDVNLCFTLSESDTLVESLLKIKRLDTDSNVLTLDGEQLELISVLINENELLKDKDYSVSDKGLQIHIDEAQMSDETFELTIKNKINPISNTSLEGLYFSNNSFCTQCEAEGFRKITYFLDRPDVLSIYTVKIVTHDNDMEHLLSNGNKVYDSGFVEGKREVIWHDPFPKPCYLFALVAGSFDLLKDEYLTKSGKKVALELYVDKGRKNKGQHALDSLKKSMQWDEDSYGLEYDLDVYMVVAVDFFNMGAMENKGLNVFNSKFVLADSNTATDEDYFNIESIIAHEYFHNWTGNRVTCRDWFQLSLKEGLTVFRDQQFSADMSSPLITRINQVKVIKEHQFAEDAGPMSHPIRPDVVMEMNNFYTVTVYDKGAEVIRMLHTLLGSEGFRKGMDLYFKRHDGQAVTCDDFVNAMQDANEHDLGHFKLWYSQSGTPIVNVNQDIEANKVVLNFRQYTAPTKDQDIKRSLFIPIKMEALDSQGNALDLDTDTVVLSEDTFSLKVNGLNPDPDNERQKIIPVLLQDFSAPVKIEYEYTFEELIVILCHSKSDYSKWEASQRCYQYLIQRLYESKMAKLTNSAISDSDEKLASPDNETKALIQQFCTALKELQVAPEVHAQLLTAPSVESVYSNIKCVNPRTADIALKKLQTMMAPYLIDFILPLYETLHEARETYAYEKSQINARRLKAISLKWLAIAKPNDFSDTCRMQFSMADNMTDKLSALKAAQLSNDSVFDDLMLEFESAYSEDPVVMDKWFSLHATKDRHDILSHLDLLQAHQQYSIKNPNKVRALIGSFAFFNANGFHQENGLGYKYLADYIIQVDSLNPQVASRLITPLIQFANYDTETQEKMKAQLVRIFDKPDLSNDLYEKISKSLQG